MDEFASPGGAFDRLPPDLVIAAVESFFDMRLDGMVTPYASYVNRVYGIRSDDGGEFVVKFYRPDRWTDEAILDEHQFLRDLSAAEVPVVAPLEDGDGDTLFGVDTEDDLSFSFALFPKRGGRGFDAESDEEWVRLGSLVGRVHLVGELRDAPSRYVVDPFRWTLPFVQELVKEKVVHPDLSEELLEITSAALERAAPLVSGLQHLRIHGDCHRGNILDRSGEGLLLIDFDDMMTGPAVQDQWLLLPDHADNCRREITMLLDGYEQFRPFDRREIDAVEALRFMRMVHFLAWRSRQRHDHWFSRDFPEWGNHAFWVKEVEDLREQSGYF